MAEGAVKKRMDVMKLFWPRLIQCLSFLAGLALCTHANAACYREAAQKYGVSETLLRAIAQVESGGRDASKVENKNSDGSRDIGRMQINTIWLPVLKRYGITEESLRDECVSIKVGAWIMAQNVERHGLNWDAVGAYNVGCRKLKKEECERRRNLYAWKVFKAIRPEQQQQVARVSVRTTTQRSGIGSVDLSDENGDVE